MEGTAALNQNDTPGTPVAFGAALRARREAAGVDLERIVAETKVSRSIFEKLEGGSFSGLPEKVFCRNFLRQYAEVIGADSDSLLEEFDRAWEHFLLASGTFSVVELDERPERPSIRWWYWLPIILAVLVVLVLVFFVVRGSRPIEGALTPDPRRSSAALPVPTEVLAPTPEMVAEILNPSPSPDTLSAQVSALVTVNENSECWIRYRDGSGATGQVLLRGGESWRLEVEGPVLLTLGNAAAATLEIAGETHRDLGQAGQVVHFRLTADGIADDESPTVQDPSNG
jgi:cytoskeleton protein RodZ